MIAYFYAETLGFDLVGERADPRPKGSVEVSFDDYQALFAAQEAGKRIQADKAGHPVLVDLPGATAEMLEADERTWRNVELMKTDGIVARHRDELEGGGATETTLTSKQYTELQTYRRQLRDWPQVGGFPSADHRPVQPGWLTEQQL